jgi:hypothetical protein
VIFEYILLVISSFLAFLYCLSIKEWVRPYQARTEIFTEPDEKLVVFDKGENLQIEGGELEPDFYYKLVRKLQEPKRQDIKIEFICGASILVEKEYEEVLRGQKGKTKNMQQYHPLFEFAHDHPDRLRIFLRTRREEHSKHYSVGTSPKLICEEDLHPRGGSKTGTFYYNDVPKWQILKRRIEQNKRKCVVWNKDVEVPFEIESPSTT